MLVRRSLSAQHQVAGESQASAQITLSSVKLCLTISKFGCSHGVSSDSPLRLFNICYESKKTFYCIKLHFHALYALLFYTHM